MKPKHLTNRERALQAINNITDECSANALAKQTGIARGTMIRYLVQERKRGNVENRTMNGRHGSRVSLWRRS